MGIAVILHSNDQSPNPPQHLATWLCSIGVVLEAGTRLKYHLGVMRELEAAAQAVIFAKLSNGNQAEALVK